MSLTKGGVLVKPPIPPKPPKGDIPPLLPINIPLPTLEFPDIRVPGMYPPLLSPPVIKKVLGLKLSLIP